MFCSTSRSQTFPIVQPYSIHTMGLEMWTTKLKDFNILYMCHVYLYNSCLHHLNGITRPNCVCVCVCVRACVRERERELLWPITKIMHINSCEHHSSEEMCTTYRLLVRMCFFHQKGKECCEECKKVCARLAFSRRRVKRLEIPLEN